MDVKKLQFFDNNGYNLNFDWNSRKGYWEGNIYLPRVSVGLYANTTIYILEEVTNNNDNEYFTNDFCFPSGTGKISFSWDTLNTFVDEFFMFNFDESYIIKETSALVYTPNDGPDCNTLIINRFDNYEVELDESKSPKALPVHIAFRASEKHDASTYNRTLVMSHNGRTIARIKFYAETVEEDERLKVWNSNLGYKIAPEETIMFYKSDIKEYMPDYILLNEKRKELMLEGSNIYPYIGSYKAIINAIKFFGYDNLNIIEYWRNVNKNDENFGKIYHSSRYSLKKKETLRIGARNIILPNKDYKKINALALVYDINKPTGEIDEWELPEVKEQFAYTIEEALIKLFALRKKLNKEFMPGSSRIIDIIGEGNYFGIQSIFKVGEFADIDTTKSDWKLDFDVYPKKYTHITDNEYFNRYINIKEYSTQPEVPFKNQMISDLLEDNVSNYEQENDAYLDNPGNIIASLPNSELCDYYLQFYEDSYQNHTMFKEIEDNDSYSFDNEEYTYYTNEFERFSAKVVLECKDFDAITFDTSDLRFDCTNYSYTDTDENGNPNFPTSTSDGHAMDFDNPKELTPDGINSYTFDNIDTIYNIGNIVWTVKMSEPENQYDDDLKGVGIIKQYESKPIGKNGNDAIVWTDDQKTGKYFLQLPYIGYYDVTMEINGQKKTKKKCIKVEPYQLEMMGFYYDIREIPADLQYAVDDESQMYNFIHNNIVKMYGWAVSERTNLLYPMDYSVPLYDASGQMLNTGPYYNENVDDEWYLADNLTWEMSKLVPLTKYTRYIRNGVDVKPYTWFLLGYDYSKIAGKVNPVWTITNNTTGESQRWPKKEGDSGRYLTLLLKKEGEYTVTLNIEDRLGNKYTLSRNIIVVTKSANYKLYQTFKKDYDYLVEQNLLKELNDYRIYNNLDLIPAGTGSLWGDMNVTINGYVREEPKNVDVIITGRKVWFEAEEKDVKIDGTVKQGELDVFIDGTVRPEEKDVIITGKVRPEDIDVIINGTVRYIEEPEVTENIDIEGTIFNTTHHIDVTIDGTVNESKDEVDVTIDGTVRNEVDVEIEGTIREAELITYSIHLNDSIYEPGTTVSWFADENMTQPITDSISGTFGNILKTTNEEVYAKIVNNNYEVNPNTLHLTKDDNYKDVEVIASYFRAGIINLSSSNFNIKWTKDEEGTEVIKDNNENFILTGEESVWVHFSADGYVPQKLHLTREYDNGQYRSTYLYKEQYTFTVTVLPEEAAAIATFKWYADEEHTQLISDTCGNTLTRHYTDTINSEDYSFAYVVVSAEGYKDASITFNGLTREDETVELEKEEDKVVLNALPLTQYNRNYPNYMWVGGENTVFPLIVSNDKQSKLQYNINIENVTTLIESQIFEVGGKQIDIGDEYSVFIINKEGYGSGGLNSTTGNFTISAENAEPISIIVKGNQGSQHDSHIRYPFGKSGKFSNIQIVPYTGSQFQFELYGADDGAAIIDENKTYHYFRNTVSEGNFEEPELIKTYSVEPNYIYNYNGTQINEYDGPSMITNTSYEINRKSSYLNYTITQNDLDRLRFSVIRLKYDSNKDSYNDCVYMNSIIQESQNLRFILNGSASENYLFKSFIDIIDLSQSGKTYDYSVSQSSSVITIYFIDKNITDKITVTGFNNEVVQGETRNTWNYVRYYYRITSEKVNGKYEDGLHITIN